MLKFKFIPVAALLAALASSALADDSPDAGRITQPYTPNTNWENPLQPQWEDGTLTGGEVRIRRSEGCELDDVAEMDRSEVKELDELNARLLEASEDLRASEEVCNLLQAGADPNARADNQATPLHKTVRNTAIPNMLLLLDAGANPNLQNNAGMTPLDRAVKLDREAAANVLRNAGGECNVHNGGLCD